MWNVMTDKKKIIHCDEMDITKLQYLSIKWREIIMTKNFKDLKASVSVKDIYYKQKKTNYF